MPTYAAVPKPFKSLSHRNQVSHLYRRILKEGATFFDERASNWIQAKAVASFQKNKFREDESRIQKYMSDARKALRALERANQMDIKAVTRILRLAYGIQGSERRKLLQPFVDTTRVGTASSKRLSNAISISGTADSPRNTPPARAVSPSSQLPVATLLSSTFEAPSPKSTLAGMIAQELVNTRGEPTYFQYQRSVPPIYMSAVAALIQSSTGKSIHPTLPVPLFKPLHGKREANLRWRYFTKQMKKVKAPLPSQLRQEMEWKARVGFLKEDTVDKDSFPGWKEWQNDILRTIQSWNRTGVQQKEQKFSRGLFHPSIGGKPARGNILTPRLYRRIWQQLLNEVPIMDAELVDPNSVASRPPKKKGKLPPPPPPPQAQQQQDQKGSFVSPGLSIAYSFSKSVYSHGAKKSFGPKVQSFVNGSSRSGPEDQKGSFFSSKNKQSK